MRKNICSIPVALSVIYDKSGYFTCTDFSVSSCNDGPTVQWYVWTVSLCVLDVHRYGLLPSSLQIIDECKDNEGMG